MSDTAERYRQVAASFAQRLEAVPEGCWDNPSPCEGWVARDVVRHVVGTSGFFLRGAGVDVPEGPSVDDDPPGAWAVACAAVQAALDDPDTAGREYDSPMGRTTLERSIGLFGIADVLIHTWDLARAAGLDETLDPGEVQQVYEAMLPNDERMRGGTAFGPKVDVPADADLQTKLIAFTGRRP